jgi:hypothetical protein
VAALAAVAVLAALTACAQVLGINSDRHVTVDAGDQPDASPEAGPPGPWDCLGNPPQTFPVANTTVKFVAVDALQMIVQQEKIDGGSGLELVQYTGIPGIPIRACSEILYPDCTKGGTMWETTDEAGVAIFTLPQSFDGFYQLNDPELFTTTFFPSQMVAGETMAEIPGTLLTNIAVLGLEGYLHNIHLSLDADGGLGHVVLSVFDCNDHFAKDVSFLPSSTSPPGSMYPTLVFYTEGMGGQELPTTNTSATDNAGAGGILNVPVGSFTVNAVLNTGQPVGTLDVIIRPGVAASAIIRARTR